jgi:DNA-binding NtrC family response regulator
MGEDNRAEPSSPSELREHTSTSRLRLLIVDDERRFLESLLLALGGSHQAEGRTRAAEALALLEASPERFDVILCDLSMPEIDGVAFYERALRFGFGDRFILMTGGAFTPRASEFMARSACPSIDKPFQLEQLLALIEEVGRGRPLA